MIKKTIKYTDFNDQEVVQDYYFHLSQVDMVELSIDGTFEERIRRAIVASDKLTIFQEFKRLISLAVGVRSEDGSSFSRPEEFRNMFMSSPAFDELIMELFTSPDQGTAFIKALLPQKMQDAMGKELEKGEGGTVNLPDESTRDPFEEKPAWIREKREPAWVRERRVPNKQEFATANSTQKLLAFQLQVEKGMEPGQDLTGYNES